MIAGNAGTGPGVAGGTVTFDPRARRQPPSPDPMRRSTSTTTRFPMPRRADYLPNFTLTNGATLKQFMLLYPVGDKTFDGSASTTLSGFRSTLSGQRPAGRRNPGAARDATATGSTAPRSERASASPIPATASAARMRPTMRWRPIAARPVSGPRA